MIHHSLLLKLNSGGFAEIEWVAVSTNNLSRSTPNGPGPSSPPHRKYADASALRTQMLAGESCRPATAARIGLLDPGGKVGSQQSAISR